MSIRLQQIKGDLVELIFNPKRMHLRVGETLRIAERGAPQGLIVQVLQFRTVNYPALMQEQLRLLAGAEERHEPELSDDAGRNLLVAVAKIRKLWGGGPMSRWDRWDGWIPSRDVEVTRVDHDEFSSNCVADQGNLLHVGQTLHGESFYLEGRALEKVNIITGVKGSGKSYLAKVLLLELIAKGAPCIVFDLNKEYIHLPQHKWERNTGQVHKKGVIHLKAGDNLKMGMRQFGLAPFLTLLTKFGLPEVSALYVENRLHRLLQELTLMEKTGKRVPFISIDQLLQMVEEQEFTDNEVVNNAIRSRLEMARNTGIFAAHASEAISLYEQYQLIRDGGALIFDISALSNLARYGFVQAIVEIIKRLCELEIERETHRFPFVFFEEAHLYVSQGTISYIVTRSRHIGITSFFVTNMVGGLDEAVLRQVDNLFVTHLPYEDDVQHLSKSAMTDKETMASFVKRLRTYHALILGQATQQYPTILRVKQLHGIETAGETKYFFQRELDRLPLLVGRGLGSRKS